MVLTAATNAMALKQNRRVNLMVNCLLTSPQHIRAVADGEADPAGKAARDGGRDNEADRRETRRASPLEKMPPSPN